MNIQPTHAQRPERMTADEYLAWAMERPGRFELVSGEVVAMAPGRVGHAKTKLRATVALEAAIRARGLDCEAIIDGVGVRVADDTVYEPDALVCCGSPLPDDVRLVPDPLIVVEVLSPSTKAVDTGKKLGGHFALPSLRHDIVLDPEDRKVIHYRREGEGVDDRIAIGILHARPPEGEAAGRQGAELVLDPPGLAVSCADLFGAP